jgi:hypothetical protein
LLPGVSTDILPCNGYPTVVTRLSGKVFTGSLPSTGHPIAAYSLLRHVFTGPLPSNGCPSIVGTCLQSRYLAMRHNIMQEVLLSRHRCLLTDASMFSSDVVSQLANYKKNPEVVINPIVCIVLVFSELDRPWDSKPAELYNMHIP